MTQYDINIFQLLYRENKRNLLLHSVLQFLSNFRDIACRAAELNASRTLSRPEKLFSCNTPKIKSKIRNGVSIQQVHFSYLKVFFNNIHTLQPVIRLLTYIQAYPSDKTVTLHLKPTYLSRKWDHLSCQVQDTVTPLTIVLGFW